MTDQSSFLELGELDEVVREHAVCAPGAGAGVAAQTGAAPRPVSLEMRDASFASGAPLDGVDELVSVFDGAARLGGSAGAWDDDGGHPGGGEIGLDGWVPVAAIGGHQRWRHAQVGAEAFDGRAEQLCVGRVPDVYRVSEDDPVGVVDDLGLVTELDGLAEASFADRSSVGLMQRDEPGGAVGLVGDGRDGGEAFVAGLLPPRRRTSRRGRPGRR